MENKKTLKYLNDMKNSKMPPFDSQYEFFFCYTGRLLYCKIKWCKDNKRGTYGMGF